MENDILNDLKELKKSFQPFSELWSEWIKSNYCELTTTEIQLIEFHISNNFKVKLTFLLSYYEKSAAIKNVIPKLIESYSNYCVWVSRTFQFSILTLMLTEFSEVDAATKDRRLQVAEDLKEVLQRFGKDNIDNIFAPDSNIDFTSGYNLELATEVLKFLFAKSQITNPQKPIPTMIETA